MKNLGGKMALLTLGLGPHSAFAVLEDFNLLLPWQQNIQQYLPPWLSSSAEPSVTIDQGHLVGTIIDDGSFPSPIEAFLGVPYALPPVGDLRYARPQPVSPSTRTLDASRYGPRCPGKQLLQIPGSESNSEDCLTANVFRPSNASTHDKLPVAVYVHGGAFNRGSATMHNTASMVAWSVEPFLAISFNYRIGAPGFLNSALTANEDLLNLGLHDQVLLLRWASENIAAFGGDPDSVTLIGVSAGAHSIGHHIMNTNNDKMLFHRAIMESGGPTSRALHPYHSKLHEEQFEVFLSEVGCDGVPTENVMSCLKQVSSAKTIHGSNTVFTKWNPSVRWAWQPVMDDDLISRRPTEAWASRKWNKVPILTGFNHNEGTMYVPKALGNSSEFEEFFASLLPQLSRSDIETLAELYPDPSTHTDSPYVDTRHIGVGSQYKRVEAAYGHYAYVCPVSQTAKLASCDASDPPIYLYHWATNTSVLGGANHADQMSYETMNAGIRDSSDAQEEIAGYFHAYITSFIVTGDPNKVRGRFPERPLWNAFVVGDEKTMVFGMGNDERAGGQDPGVSAQLIEDEWARKECDFWWDQSSNCED